MNRHPSDWRRVESALVRTANSYGYEIIEDTDSGDKLAHNAIMIPDTDNYDDLNLTEFAKDLARELGL